MRSIALLVLLSTVAASPEKDFDASRWGAAGHEMAARAAVSALPASIPVFFREAGDQLVYLNPEPDRWRSRVRAGMDQAWTFDHYINLENVPGAALEAPDRFEYIRTLRGAGLERPERDGGFLPFRMLELYQRVVTEWELWRSEVDPRNRRWIEARIINDAGILGHYVTDAAQPHHTTIHHNGWAAGARNPEGYLDDRTFHARFESDFVERHVSQADVTSRIPAELPATAAEAWTAILELVRRSHGELDTLYRLDRDVGFSPTGPATGDVRAFAAERLADGAHVLAILWWSAWLESGSVPSRGAGRAYVRP